MYISVAAGVRLGVVSSWSVGSSGFPLRHTHGNPGDRFLPIEMFLDHVRVGSRKLRYYRTI